MWMSAGGVIGGIFAGLIAPNVFTWVLEYPVLIVLAILCRPGLAMPTDCATRLLWLGAIAIVAVAAYPGPDRALRHRREDLQLDHRRDAGDRRARLARAAAVRRRDRGRRSSSATPTGPTAKCARRCAASSACTRSPRPPTGSTACSCTAPRSTAPSGCATIRASRSTGRPPMITYYHRQFADGRHREGDARARRRADQGRGGRARHRHLRVLLASRATASSSTRSTPACRRWRAIRTHFRYLTECAPDVPIVLGDARLTLAESTDKYDLIVLDAFSSDAIPIHLMTREAMAIYASTARAARHRADAHLEPAHGTRLGGGRHRACQRAGQPPEQPRARAKARTTRSTSSPRRW